MNKIDRRTGLKMGLAAIASLLLPTVIPARKFPLLAISYSGSFGYNGVCGPIVCIDIRGDKSGRFRYEALVKDHLDDDLAEWNRLHSDTVGAILGLTKQRIRQIHDHGIYKIQRGMAISMRNLD